MTDRVARIEEDMSDQDRQQKDRQGQNKKKQARQKAEAVPRVKQARSEHHINMNEAEGQLSRPAEKQSAASSLSAARASASKANKGK